jgi:hypothetical protein
LKSFGRNNRAPGRPTSGVANVRDYMLLRDGVKIAWDFGVMVEEHGPFVARGCGTDPSFLRVNRSGCATGRLTVGRAGTIFAATASR